LKSQGLLGRDIAAKLSVSIGTVYYWINPSIRAKALVRASSPEYRAKTKQYADENRESINAKKRARNSTQEGKQKNAEQWARYADSHKDALREASAEYRENNRELLRLNKAEYRSTDHGKSVRAAAQTNRVHRLRANGGGVSRDELATLMKEQSGLCKYCGCVMATEGDPNSPTYKTIDHVKPVSRGGKHKIGNIVLCCRKCNCIKGAKEV